MSWNCCGLGNPTTGQRLKEIHKKNTPDIMFLCETKNPTEMVKKELEWFNSDKFMAVPPVTPGSGGLYLRTNSEDPWFLTGDFNEIVDNTEKCGGPVRAEGTFVNFRSFLSSNGLFDLKYSGPFLSWRGQRHSHLVRCRLDRAISNSVWAELFPACRSQYLKFEGSDHRPLLSFLNTARK